MRYLHFGLCVLMIVFAAVQYNDPDGLLWVVIYMVPGLWAALAAFRPRLLTETKAFYLLAACVAAEIALMVMYWPTTPGFWRQDVWWETETAREGMGTMISALVIAVVFLSAWRQRRPADVPAAPD